MALSKLLAASWEPANAPDKIGIGYTQNLAVDVQNDWFFIGSVVNLSWIAATWMLEVSTVSAERKLGCDFADIYTESGLYT